MVNKRRFQNIAVWLKKFESDIWGGIFVWIFVAAFIIFVTVINWRFEFLLYADYRTDILNSLLEQIQSGIIPDFLNVSIHSWSFSLYLPYLAYVLQIDFDHLFFYMQMITATVTLIAFSIEVHFLYRKRILTVAAPILVYIFCGNQLYGFKTQTFWTAAPMVVVCVPLFLFLLRTKKEKVRIALSVAIGLICSAGNVLRNQVGFPIMIAFMVILLYILIRSKHKVYEILFFLVRLVIFMISYYIISSLIPYFIGIFTGSPVLNNEGMVWHSMLCGLGFEDNLYGLAWSDSQISNLIYSKYGYAAYSNEYLAACKDYFIEIFKKNPGFIVGTWTDKFFRCISWSFKMLFFPDKYLASASNGDFYYFNSSIYCLRNILVPTMLASISSVCFLHILKNVDNRENRTRTNIEIIAILLIIIMVGTVQGVLGNDKYITYYMPTIAAMSLFPCVILLNIAGQYLEERCYDYGQ